MINDLYVFGDGLAGWCLRARPEQLAILCVWFHAAPMVLKRSETIAVALLFPLTLSNQDGNFRTLESHR